MTKFIKTDGKADAQETEGVSEKLLGGLKHQPPVHTQNGILRIGKLKKEEPAPSPFGPLTPKKY